MGKRIAKTIPYEGQMRTILDVATQLGMSRAGLATRIKQVEQGKITMDVALTKGQLSTGKKPLPPEEEIPEPKMSDAKRTEALNALFQAFKKYGIPALERDMKRYIRKNGPLRFYKEFGHLFPKTGEVPGLDNYMKKEVATVNLVYINNTNTTVSAPEILENYEVL